MPTDGANFLFRESSAALSDGDYSQKLLNTIRNSCNLAA